MSCFLLLLKNDLFEKLSFRDSKFHAISDHQTVICLMIAYGVKLEVRTETRNFPCVGIVHRLRELSALMGF